jgi:Ni/Fe-hydrogenase subunit HybB-like protein
LRILIPYWAVHKDSNLTAAIKEKMPSILDTRNAYKLFFLSGLSLLLITFFEPFQGSLSGAAVVLELISTFLAFAVYIAAFFAAILAIKIHRDAGLLFLTALTGTFYSLMYFHVTMVSGSRVALPLIYSIVVVAYATHRLLVLP